MCLLFFHVNSLAHNYTAQVEMSCENEAVVFLRLLYRFEKVPSTLLAQRKWPGEDLRYPLLITMEHQLKVFVQFLHAFLLHGPSERRHSPL